MLFASAAAPWSGCFFENVERQAVAPPVEALQQEIQTTLEEQKVLTYVSFQVPGATGRTEAPGEATRLGCRRS